MKKLLKMISVIAYFALIFINSSYADGKATLVGRRYECMYYNDNGVLTLIANPEERPYVEFLSSQKCRYMDSSENGTYTIVANKIVLIESGIFPMLSFETMSDGRLRLDGLGLMYYSMEGYDEWFYNTSSTEYASLEAEAEVLRAEEEKLKSSIAGIEHLTDIFPFRNGYACVKDDDNVYHYFDANGQIIFENHYPYISNLAWPIDSGVTLTRESESNVHKMVDLNNQVIREFDATEYSWIGVPAGGFIATVKITSSMSGSTQTVVYYDVSGNEAFSFPGLSILKNGLSNFYSDRAFLKNSDNEYVLIDTKGNQRALSVNNQELLVQNLESYWIEKAREYGMENNRHYAEIETVKIDSVNSFTEGANYASANIEVTARIHYEDKYGWKELYYREDYAASISRSGTVKLLGEAESSPLAAPCKNGIILVSTSHDSIAGNGYNAWYVPSTGELIELKAIPELSSGKNHSIVFMDDGNLLVTMRNADQTARYYAIVDRFGKLVSGPTKDDVGLPSYTFVTDPYKSSSYDSDRSILNIVSSDLIFYGMERYGLSGKIYKYYDSNGNQIGGEYSLGTNFSNGYAIVAKGTSTEHYIEKAEDLVFINARGEEVDSVELIEEVNHFEGDEIEALHSQSKTIEIVKTILSTDDQFRLATNAALPNVVAGETLGYIYDIATFDIFGLIKHIGSDATKEYQKDAARAIERSLLSNHNMESLSGLIHAFSEVIHSDQIGTARDFKSVIDDTIARTNSAVSRSNYPNATIEIPELDYLDGMLKGIDLLAPLIDATELELEQKAVIAVLVSNYSTNMDYVESCIAQARNAGNTEMVEIYDIVKNDLYEYYQAYIEGAKRYVVEEGLDFIRFEQIVDTADTILSVSGVDTSITGRIASMSLPQEVMKRVNMLLVVHGIVSEASRKLGTDSTYESMQDLYENAIVINAMVKDLSSALVEYQRNPSNHDNIIAVKNKGLALAEYRLISLDNLRSYYENCFSGQTFLDINEMQREEYVLLDCVDYLSSLAT